MIVCARATRGLGRSSLDTRTIGRRQATPHNLAEGEKWWTHTGIGRLSLKSRIFLFPVPLNR